jgi:hypothetical protein
LQAEGRKIVGVAAMFIILVVGACMIGISGCPGTESAIGMLATNFCNGWDLPSIEFIIGAIMMIFAIPVGLYTGGMLGSQRNY